MLGFSSAHAQTASNKTPYNQAQPVTLPSIFPTPVSIKLTKGSIVLGKSVVLIVASGVGSETLMLLRTVITSAGVTSITVAQQLPQVLDRPYLVLGTGDAPVVRSALSRSDAVLDTHKGGYTLTNVIAGKGALITLAGYDADGLFHAVQSFRQLVQRPVIPALIIQDYPAMLIRGTIEGFYGAPWSMADRTKHLNFLASVKANTYVYSPKDDPYARDRWREAYPAAILNELSKLVFTARQNHVNFVYAISLGPSICFSDPADRQALSASLMPYAQSMFTSFMWHLMILNIPNEIATGIRKLLAHLARQQQVLHKHSC